MPTSLWSFAVCQQTLLSSPFLKVENAFKKPHFLINGINMKVWPLYPTSKHSAWQIATSAMHLAPALGKSNSSPTPRLLLFLLKQVQIYVASPNHSCVYRLQDSMAWIYYRHPNLSHCDYLVLYQIGHKNKLLRSRHGGIVSYASACNTNSPCGHLSASCSLCECFWEINRGWTNSLDPYILVPGEAPGFDLAQINSFQVLGEWISKWKSSLSLLHLSVFSVALPFK